MGEFLVDETGRKLKLNYAHGTTTLGFKFKGGTVLAADSRATSGQYIGEIFNTFWTDICLATFFF